MNPEESVIADIDALVDESLSHGPLDDYSRPVLARIEGGVVSAERCAVCNGQWHGLEIRSGCPSEFGTDEEVANFRARRITHAPKAGEPVLLGEHFVNMQYYGVVSDIDVQPTGTIIDGVIRTVPDDPLSRAYAAIQSVWECLATLTGMPVEAMPITPGEMAETLQNSMTEALRAAGIEDDTLTITYRRWLQGDQEPLTGGPRGAEATMYQFDEARSALAITAVPVDDDSPDWAELMRCQPGALWVLPDSPVVRYQRALPPAPD